MVRTDLGLSIPFPRILLRLLKILLSYVAIGLNVYSSTSSSPAPSSSSSSSTSSSSSPLSHINPENESVTVQNNTTLPTSIDTPEKRSGNRKYGSPDINKFRKAPVATTEFDRLRNLFPEIPAIFSAQARTASNTSSEYKDGNKKNSDDLGSNSRSSSNNSNSQERKDDTDISSGTYVHPENKSKKIKGKKNILSIGFAELWLQCLKVLVNLTQNCAIASDILMQEKNDEKNNQKREGKSEEKIGRRKEERTKGKNFENDRSVERSTSSKCSSEKDVGDNNIMTVCCTALYFSISKRNSQTVQAYTKRTCPDVTAPSGSPVESGGPILTGTLSPSETAEEVSVYVCVCM
jgi:hypothetical protein